MQPPVQFRPKSRPAPTSVEAPPVDALALFEPERSIGRSEVDASIDRPAIPSIDQSRSPGDRVQVRAESPQHAVGGTRVLWFVVGVGCSALIALAALLMYSFSPLPLPSVASPLAASHWVILRGVDSSRTYVNVPLPLSD